MAAEPRGGGTRAALAQALPLFWLRRPRSDLRYGIGAAFWLLLLLVLLEVALGWVSSGGHYTRWQFAAALELPRLFSPEGLIGSIASFGGILLAAWLAALALGRSAAFWPLFVLVLALWLLFTAVTGIATLAVLFQVDEAWPTYRVLRLAWVVLWLLLAWRLLAGFSPATRRPRRALALLPLAVFTVGGLWLHAWPEYWPPDYQALAERAREAEQPAAPAVDHEAVMYAQPALLQQAIAGLPPQRPGVADLYAIGFAGDGSERVFANEVRYFADLVDSRYGNGGRTLLLVNDPDSATAAPIATLTALRAALAGVAARMDVDEDVLMLFLTTHGSEDHELLVQLGDLPLWQLTPEDLAAALDESGIRWRIVLISACYSGGYIEALADPHALVLTAARADRTSFGCGVASDITWFGQALMADALNRERDPVQAFAMARAAIAEREKEDELTPSDPQIHVGEAIAERLPAWLEAWPDHGPVPFHPPE